MCGPRENNGVGLRRGHRHPDWFFWMKAESISIWPDVMAGEVVDHAPLNTPKSTTILSSIRLDGTMAFTTFQGGTTGDKFLTYLKKVLIPTLRPGDIVVMDNLRTHHIQKVSELLHSAEAEVLYLPAYSPDLNPIEKLWSKVKAILRKLRVRSPDALDAAIRFAFRHVSPDDCSGWFRCAAYCLF